MEDLQKITWTEENKLRFTTSDFDTFIEWCFHQQASDIYIESGEVLAMKLYGEVVEVGEKIITYEEISEILETHYQPAAQTLMQSGQELNFQHSILLEDESLIRFRVNATACQASGGSRHGAEIVLRTIPGVIPTCEDLGIGEELKAACNAKYGIILVTGPTGSGKSTTIAGFINHIAQNRSDHILTYENPIEFDLKMIPNRKARIVQSEIPAHLEDYKLAVANSLRRSPDVILYGEARDKKTIEACILEAQTGHLVLTTVHTNGVPPTIARMADEFDARERKSITIKLIDCVQMIVHQRLYRKLTGGRVAIREYLIFTEKMRRQLQTCLLKREDIGTDILELLNEHGRPLLTDGKEAFAKGLLDFGEYIKIVGAVGSLSDLDIVPEVARELLSKNVINEQTFETWIEEYNTAVA